MLALGFWVLVGGLAVSVANAGAATEIGDYEFQGDLSSTNVIAPPMTALGAGNAYTSDLFGGTSRQVLGFPAGGGVSVSSMPIQAKDYSIAMLFKLDDTAGYNRIFDGSDGTSDSGVYDNSGKVDIYSNISTFPSHPSPDVVFTNGAYAELEIVGTLNPTTSTTANVDGTPRVSTTFYLNPNNTLRFFKDNTSGGSTGEESSGHVACIRIFSGALSPAELSAIHAQGVCTVGLPTGPPPPPVDSDAPETTFKGKAKKRIHDRTPTFKFESDEPGSSFSCQVDKAVSKPCESPFTTKRLKRGRHAFRVDATDTAGNLDPTPAKRKFKIAG